MITILFSCKSCGLTDCDVRVESREKATAAVDWMREVVAAAIAGNHVLMSPLCTAKEMSDLKIPIPGNDPDCWIGKQTDLIPPKGLNHTRDTNQARGKDWLS